MGTKIRHKGWESQNNLLTRKVKTLERDKEALVKSRDYLMDSIAETNKTHVAERQDRQKALDVERGAMQEHITRLRGVNQKILMEARKAGASVVLVSPSERTKADETELKCFIQVIEAWAQEQEFKLAALITQTEPGDKFWGKSIMELIAPYVKSPFRQEYPVDLDGASVIKARQGASFHPGKVTDDMMKKIIMKHTIKRRGGTK